MLLDKIESVCVWKIWMRGNDPIMRRFILAVFSVLIVATNYSYGERSIVPYLMYQHERN